MAVRRRKFWGWGWEDEGPTPEQQQRLAQLLAMRFGRDFTVEAAPRLEELSLRAPRVAVPATLRDICSIDSYDRAGHAYGKAFRDVVRAFRRSYAHPPDIVAFPRDEREVAAVLNWCADVRAAAIPYGGGSSVVGGVEPRCEQFPATVSIDLHRLNQVLEVDRISRAARIQAGVYGPELEDQLRPHGFTLRHFPQSFEFSTLGGWIATRSGGHFATLYTHIDEFVESLRVLTPTGIVESRRLPGSGAGPSPDRLFIGSEGTLGIITEAWMRLQDRPRFRASAAASFEDFAAAVAATRAVSQAGLYPANCRLLDAGEALTAGAGDGTQAVLLIAFESADHALDAWMTRAIEICRDHGGTVAEGAGRTQTDTAGARDGAAGAWRKSFVGAPYLRDTLVAMGLITDTFETAVTWNRFEEFHANVLSTAQSAVNRICGTGQITCRVTHVYPDGPAPYYTVLAPGKRNSQLEQWDEIKSAVSPAVLEFGGTITHHHAVGRDHRPWYDQQRPEGFARVLRAAKAALDPTGVLNPGVLID
jgi:alkyldihydroxyacetonephosphate synthase